MTAFEDSWVYYSFGYLAQTARAYDCNPCFDGIENITKKVAKMNEKGDNGYLGCLCKVNTMCPCTDLEKDLQDKGVCYCGIFRRVEK
jgi:ferredoxin-thioredoxin reductase catalytic subunit